MNENDNKLLCDNRTKESGRNDDKLSDQQLTSAENKLLFTENAGSIETCSITESQHESLTKIPALETRESSLNSNLDLQVIHEILDDSNYDPGSFDVGDTIVFPLVIDNEKDENITHVEEIEQTMVVKKDHAQQEEENSVLAREYDDSIDKNNQDKEEDQSNLFVEDEECQTLEKLIEDELLKGKSISEDEEYTKAKLEYENLGYFSSFYNDDEETTIFSLDDKGEARIKLSDHFSKNRFSSVLGEIDFIDFLSDFRNKCHLSDFSNKLLIIKNNNVEVVKSRLRSSSEDKMIFVIDLSLLKQIKENTYNLDDLQYGIARAIGIEPEKIKISYIVNQLKNIKTDYSHVKLGRMWEQKLKYESTQSIYQITPKPFQIKNINIVAGDAKNEQKNIKMFIHNYSSGKKWLGGYRNKETGTLYFDTATQTSKSFECSLSKSSKNIQTRNPTKEKAISTQYDHSTQVWRLDYYIPADTDLIINPGIYGKLDSNKMQPEQAAIIFQKLWRGYKVRKYKIPKLQEEKKSIQINTMAEKIMLNMIYPYKKYHFSSLYWILKKRKLYFRNKLNVIDNNKSSKVASIVNTIDNTAKELESLKGIEMLRQAAKLNRIEKEKIEFLEQSFGPTITHFPDRDNIYFIEEFGKENCKRIKELYVLYRRQDIKAEQRLEVLLLCLQAIEDCSHFEMKEDLQELLSRECILISSGMPENYLQGLRKRAEEIIYNFVKIPLRRIKSKKFMQYDLCPIFRCFHCKKYKNCQDFPIIVENKFKICKSCRFTHRSGSVLENTSFKTYHLQLLRLDEYRRGCQNPYVTLVQPSTIHDIIFKLWGGRCAISGETVFRYLRLVRWDTREPWAPWNTILLSKKEATEHCKIKNVYNFYSEYFCNYVKKKNLLALKKYAIIVNVENSMRNVWSWLPHRIIKTNAKLLANASNAAGEAFFHPSHKSNIC